MLKKRLTNILLATTTLCSLVACTKATDTDDTYQLSANAQNQPRASTTSSFQPKIDKRMPVNAFHPKLLSADQEKSIVELVKSHRTSDGFTVSDVLQYAETQLPEKFKVAKYDIFYTQAGNPSLVGICYWLGDRRLEDELVCDLDYTMSSDYRTVAPDTSDTAKEATKALQNGKATFVAFMQKAYNEQCVDPATGKKGC